jgi:hypothetical protein
MINEDGHVMHIDFGVMFDVAPGRVRSEKGVVSGSGEMVQLMGGSKEALRFQEFIQLFVQGFSRFESGRQKLMRSRFLCDMLDSIPSSPLAFRMCTEVPSLSTR